MQTKHYQHGLLTLAVLVAGTVPARAQWQVSTTYSGTTQYDQLASTAPTHTLTNYLYTYTVPTGSNTLPNLFLSGSFIHSGVPSITEQYLISETRLADTNRADERLVVNATVIIEFRWIGATPPPSVTTWILQNYAKIEKTGLPFWNNSLARSTVTTYDITTNPFNIIPLATMSSSVQLGANASGSGAHGMLTTQDITVQRGYGRYRLAVEGYGRHRFGPTLGASSVAWSNLRLNVFSVTP